MPDKKPYLSVVIPAYGEAKNIRHTLNLLLPELDTYAYSFEVIVVVDGSPDETEAEAKKITDPRLTILSYQPNHGKGYAFYYGAARAKGEVVVLFDAGGDYSPDHVGRFVQLYQIFEADIVIGSKRHPASHVHYPRQRRVISFFAQALIWLLFHLNVKDTQVGLKVFRKKVLDDVMPRALVKQYMFDLELLVIAKRLGYSRIFEAPVNLDFNAVTSGVKLKSIIQAGQDTAAIFYRRYLVRYYDRPHRRLLNQISP